MLAIVISFYSIFFSPGVETVGAYVVVSDSTKRPAKNKVVDSIGVFLEVNRIFIIGNRITRDQIILRELSLKKGDIVYSTDIPGILDKDKKKLVNTRLFNKVEIRTMEAGAGKIDILIDLNERWYTFPAPVFELSDRNFNEWWQNYDHDFKRVHYGLRLYQFNMRGRNETMRFIAQFGFQRRFELMYRFPYIDRRQKHGLAIELGFFETKNLSVRTAEHKYQFVNTGNILRADRFAGVTYNYRKSFYTTHSLKAEFRSLNVNDSVKAINPNYIKGEGLGQDYTWISYQYSVDRRDIFAYPLKGYQFTASASKIGLGLGDDVNKTEVNILYSKYFDLKKGFYLSNNMVGYWSTPDDLSYANYGVLGLKKQFVRGYEIYVIEGPYYIMNKTTFKKLIFSRDYQWTDMPFEQFRHLPISIYLKAYGDLAYVKNYPDYRNANINMLLSDRLISGVGMGLDFVGSYDLVLRFEYSLNDLGNHGFFFHVKREF